MMEGVGNNSSNSTGCPTTDDIALVRLFIELSLIVISIVILLVLSFTQKRKALWPNCLWKVPGIPVPVDFVVTPRYRTIYTIIFGIMAASSVATFQSVSFPADNFYLKTFYRLVLQPLVVVLMLSMIYFPLFACVKAPRPLLGRVLGLMYSTIWFLSIFLRTIFDYIPTICDPQHNKPVEAVPVIIDVFSTLPIMVMAVIIVVWYGYKVVTDLIKLLPGGRTCAMEEHEMADSVEDVGSDNEDRQYQLLRTHHHSTAHGVKHYHLLHVKSLLKKPLPPIEYNFPRRIFFKVKNYFFPYSRGFRFPLPFLGAIVAMSMLLYQLTITIVISGISLSASIPITYNKELAPLLSNLSILTNHSKIFVEIEEIAQIAFVGIPALVCVGPVLSFILCLSLLIHMVGSVSKDCKRAAIEGFTVPLPSPSSRVPSSWKYIGYQIGFFILAYGIYTGLAVVLGLVLAALFFGFRFYPDLTIQLLLYIGIPVVWSQAVFYAQSIACKLAFFEDQKGKFIALTNRRLFNWFSYILFFYNGIAGFVNAILRTIMASLFTLLLLFRLDRVVLMKGFERFDFGHKAYLGYMYLDYTYNNAVLHTFIGLLRKTVRDRMRESERSIAFSEEGQSQPEQGNFYKNIQARNRWLVAYTLVRNPSLIKYTANNINKESIMEEQAEDTDLAVLPMGSTNFPMHRAGHSFVDSTGISATPSKVEV